MKAVLDPIRFVLTDIIGSVLFFPVWWYTKGTIAVIELIARELKGFADSLNLRILLRFLFTPMFGQYDVLGRIISFWVRIVHFIVLFISTIVYTVVLCVLFVAWLMLPIVVVYNLLFHLGVIPSIYG